MFKNVLSLFFLVAVLVATGQSKEALDQITGKVTDANTRKAIPQCNVYIKGADIGTVTNNNGEFALKITSDLSEGILVVSFIGYETFETPIQDIKDQSLQIRLKVASTLLDEVIVGDVSAILLDALKKKDQNYPTEFKSMTSFYRELVKKNRKYVEVSQGILNISKSPYNSAEKDQMYIVKGSRMEDYSKKDTLAFKVVGGPNVMLLLDLVKNPGLVLHPEIFPQYEYTLVGSQLIDNKQNYVIGFKPLGNSAVPLYTGVIYVDKSSLAISGLEFEFDRRNMGLAYGSLIKKQPFSVKITPVNIAYEVKYREVDGLWYLEYVRNEVEMKCKWKKRLFNSTFRAVSEMVVTDKDNDLDFNVTAQNASRLTDLFGDKVVGFADQDFWEHYSIIEPEEDLRRAIAKIDKKASKE